MPEIKDSGERTAFETGAVRDMHEGKGRFDLLPMCVLMRLAQHYEAGAKKYSDRNWEKGIPAHSFADSAMRHLVKYLDGWDDEDHLIAAIWNLCGLAWTEEKKPEMMDIPARGDHKGIDDLYKQGDIWKQMEEPLDFPSSLKNYYDLIRKTETMDETNQSEDDYESSEKKSLKAALNACGLRLDDIDFDAYDDGIALHCAFNTGLSLVPEYSDGVRFTSSWGPTEAIALKKALRSLGLQLDDFSSKPGEDALTIHCHCD